MLIWLIRKKMCSSVTRRKIIDIQYSFTVGMTRAIQFQNSRYHDHLDLEKILFLYLSIAQLVTLGAWCEHYVDELQFN